MSSAPSEDMFVVIKCMGIAGTAIDPDPSYPKGPVGQWLQSYNPEAYQGRGDSLWTDDPEKAMRFSSSTEAFEFYQKAPKSKPLRPDGQPNRPLTAFAVLIQPLSKARLGEL